MGGFLWDRLGTDEPPWSAVTIATKQVPRGTSVTIGAVRRYECVNDVVKAVRCWGWAYVYWNEGEYVVAEADDDHGELLGIFTARYAARNGAWSLAEQILATRGL